MIRCALERIMEDEDWLRSARRAAVGALAAELGHDILAPLNLLRLITDRAAHGEPLDAEDFAALREELERLSAIGVRLRRLAQHPLRREPCSPRQLVERALRYLPALPPLELDLMPVSFSGDAELLATALAELLDNAARARRTRMGVRFARGERTGLCVWDDGPGFALAEARARSWAESSREGAAGLGLTVAFRAARAHGFGLETTRRADLTELWLTIPPSALGDTDKLSS